MPVVEVLGTREGTEAIAGEFFSPHPGGEGIAKQAGQLFLGKAVGKGATQNPTPFLRGGNANHPGQKHSVGIFDGIVHLDNQKGPRFKPSTQNQFDPTRGKVPDGGRPG